MFRQFKFEEALYPKLEGIPLSTRFKLDTIGVEFPLPIWGRLALEERWVLCHMPIRSKGERECYAAEDEAESIAMNLDYERFDGLRDAYDYALESEWPSEYRDGHSEALRDAVIAAYKAFRREQRRTA